MLMDAASISGLGRALVQSEHLLVQDAESIQRQAQASNISFVERLVLSKKLTPLAIAKFASGMFGLPLLDLATISPDSLPKGVIDDELIAGKRLLPLFKRGSRLFVGTSDPTQSAAFHAITFKTGLTVDVVVVEDDKLAKLVGRYTENAAVTAFNNMAADEFGELEIADPDAESASDGMPDVDDAPVVKFVNKVLLDAINGGASDIHFEPYERFYRVRYRIDGNLKEVVQPPLAIKEKIASRIKVISRLNIAEKRVPQDGRMRLVLSKSRAIDFRVSTLPTMYGEKIVLRILDPSSATLGIDALGYEPEQKALLLDAVQRPYGMVLVTGPTGSGKTVSLYTCLNILNKPGINISTAEDPAEIPLPGINQVNIDDRQGLTFPVALKAFLRQDPDIIMVGEIRDLETAEIAIKAAQTGHMVLSTLHTNDAPSTLTRLMNMGVPTFNIASSILLITAQRLVRRLCTCKQKVDAPIETLLNAGFLESDLDGSWSLYGPGSCDRCKGNGYKGRVGVYQVMAVSEDIQRLIMGNGTALDIAEQARREGVNDLRRSGLLKVKQGLTSLDEVLANTNI